MKDNNIPDQNTCFVVWRGKHEWEWEWPPSGSPRVFVDLLIGLDDSTDSLMQNASWSWQIWQFCPSGGSCCRGLSSIMSLQILYISNSCAIHCPECAFYTWSAKNTDGELVQVYLPKVDIGGLCSEVWKQGDWSLTPGHVLHFQREIMICRFMNPKIWLHAHHSNSQVSFKYLASHVQLNPFIISDKLQITVVNISSKSCEYPFI